MQDKLGKRFCDRCHKELTERKYDENPHDLIMLGWKKEGLTISKRYDVCRECADEFDQWMNCAQG